MGAPRLSTPELRVIMRDGSQHQVQALNIDLVNWDRDRAKHKWPSPQDAPFVWLNYLAWHILRREGVFPDMTLREFEEAAAEVSSLLEDSQEEDDGPGADPTQSGAEPE